MAQGHEMAFFCYQFTRGEARKEQGTNVVVKVYDMIVIHRAASLHRNIIIDPFE